MLGVYTWSAEAGRAARVAEAGESTTMKKADFEMVRSGDEENNGESPLSASVMNPMSLRESVPLTSVILQVFVWWGRYPKLWTLIDGCEGFVNGIADRS